MSATYTQTTSLSTVGTASTISGAYYKDVVVTVGNGDLIVAWGASADSNSGTSSAETIAGTADAWTPDYESHTASTCAALLTHTVARAAGSFTVRLHIQCNSSSTNMGGGVWVLPAAEWNPSGTLSATAANASNGQASLSPSTTSLVFGAIADWSAATIGSTTLPTGGTIESNYDGTSDYSLWAADWAAQTSGTRTYGPPNGLAGTVTGAYLLVPAAGGGTSVSVTRSLVWNTNSDAVTTNTANLWSTAVAGTTGSTWTNTTNATGTNDAARATFTTATAGAIGTIDLGGFGAQTAIGATPASVNSVVATVYAYVANTARWTSMSVSLFDGTTQIGAPQTFTLTTTTTNSQAFTFTGVTWANLANLEVRVSGTKSNTTSSTMNVDAVNVVVNYTTVAKYTATASRYLLWNVLSGSGTTTVTTTRALSWTVRAYTPVATRVLSWTVRAIAPAPTRTLQWSNLSLVSVPGIISWGVRQATLAARSMTWSVIGPVLTTRVLQWSNLSNASATRALQWNNLSLVAPTHILSWRVLSATNAPRVLLWTVLSGAASASRTLQWNTLSATNAPRVLQWSNLSTVAPATRALSWGNLSLVLTTRALQWNVIGQATTSRVLQWRVFSSSSVSTVWGTGIPTGATQTADNGSYNLGTVIQVNVDGNINAIRILLQAPRDPFSTTVRLYIDGTTTAVRETTFSVPTTTVDGWVEVAITPYTVTAGQYVMAAYTIPGGFYSSLTNAFASSITSGDGNLTAPSSPTFNGASGNGRFTTTLTAIPDSTFNATSYFADLSFTAAGTTTPVAASRSTSWNNLQAVSTTRALSWNNIQSITASRALLWNVNYISTVIASRALLWNTLNTASTTRALQWNNLTLVAPTRTLSWGVRAAVIPTRTLIWTVTGSPTPSSRVFGTGVPGGSEVNDTNVYNLGTVIRANVAGNITALRYYQTPSMAAQIVTLRLYVDGSTTPVATATNDQVAGAEGWVEVSITPYAISSGQYFMAAYTTNGYYRALPAAFGTDIVSSDGNLTAPSSPTFNGVTGNGRYTSTQTAIPDSTFNGTSYYADVVFSTYTTTSVTVTRGLQWNNRSSVTPTRALLWNVLSSNTTVSTSRTLAWAVTAPATATRQLLWNVLPTILNAYPGIAYPGTAYPGYTTATSVTATRTISWNVAAPATTTRTISFTVRSATLTSRTLQWAVRSGVVSTRNLLWTNRAFVSTTRVLQWSNLSAVTPTRVLSWKVRSAVTPTRVLLWNVISTAPASNDYYWDGTTWKPLLATYWDGTAWKSTARTYWNGTAWV